MNRFLPLIFLVSFAALFGISWIIVGADPQNSPWQVFGLLVFLIFVAVFGLLGLLIYFARVRFKKRFEADYFVKSSFKAAFFVAIFVSLISVLKILQLATKFNILLLIVAILLFVIWSYLGKKK